MNINDAFPSNCDRFWSKVKRTSTCWEWTGHRDRLGYGRFGLMGKVVGAHRLSWEFANGDIPTSMHVCHHCDNRGCVNPLHLFIGTHADNMADRDRKGRRCAPKGQSHASAKLTDVDVAEIRRLRQSGNLLREIARQFNVGISHVHRIIAGVAR